MLTAKKFDKKGKEYLLFQIPPDQLFDYNTKLSDVLSYEFEKQPVAKQSMVTRTWLKIQGASLYTFTLFVRYDNEKYYQDAYHETIQILDSEKKYTKGIIRKKVAEFKQLQSNL